MAPLKVLLKFPPFLPLSPSRSNSPLWLWCRSPQPRRPSLSFSPLPQDPSRHHPPSEQYQPALLLQPLRTPHGLSPSSPPCAESPPISQPIIPFRPPPPSSPSRAQSLGRTYLDSPSGADPFPHGPLAIVDLGGHPCGKTGRIASSLP